MSRLLSRHALVGAALHCATLACTTVACGGRSAPAIDPMPLATTSSPAKSADAGTSAANEPAPPAMPWWTEIQVSGALSVIDTPLVMKEAALLRFDGTGFVGVELDEGIRASLHTSAAFASFAGRFPDQMVFALKWPKEDKRGVEYSLFGGRSLAKLESAAGSLGVVRWSKDRLLAAAYSRNDLPRQTYFVSTEPKAKDLPLPIWSRSRHPHCGGDVVPTVFTATRSGDVLVGGTVCIGWLDSNQAALEVWRAGAVRGKVLEPQGTAVLSIAAQSADRFHAIVVRGGTSVLVRWDGSNWLDVPVDDGGLTHVMTTSTGELWGASYDPSYVVRIDGEGRWQRIPLPATKERALPGVLIGADDSIWVQRGGTVMRLQRDRLPE